MSHQSELISTNIDEYLATHEQKEILRFLTCGNVDDGKSTLIGRLLHDSKMIYEDQLAAIEKDSVKSGTTGNKPDLALLVDGLQAEREQGITIDVAYRYFSTAKRKFIIADTPGHEQYTRNMATGASNCDLAIILVDARHGVQTQTRRHSYISSLLGIKNLVVAVNKMDLIDYCESRFEKIKQDYLSFAANLQTQNIQFIPISALDGDNIVNPSSNMSWYNGQTLMQILENTDISIEAEQLAFRMPIQYVSRPNLNFRGFCGTIAAGSIKPSDEVVALPSGKKTRIKAIHTFDGETEQAFLSQAVTLTLEDEIDLSRGDMLVSTEDLPLKSDQIHSHIIWMNDAPLQIGKPYWFKFAGKTVTGTISRIHQQIDVNSQQTMEASELCLNEIGKVTLSLDQAVSFDSYQKNKTTGALIVIDPISHATLAGGMIIEKAQSTKAYSTLSGKEKAKRFMQRPCIISLNKEQARLLDSRLFELGKLSAITTQEHALAFKQAGLISLLTNGLEHADVILEGEESLEEILALLKKREYI